MKRAVRRATGCRSRGSRAVGSAAELAALEGPLIVKPVDSRGARGVIRLGAGVDPEWAFAAARAESPTGRVMAERFLDGPQVSTESLVIGGVAHTVGSPTATTSTSSASRRT